MIRGAINSEIPELPTTDLFNIAGLLSSSNHRRPVMFDQSQKIARGIIPSFAKYFPPSSKIKSILYEENCKLLHGIASIEYVSLTPSQLQILELSFAILYIFWSGLWERNLV